MSGLWVQAGEQTFPSETEHTPTQEFSGFVNVSNATTATVTQVHVRNGGPIEGRWEARVGGTPLFGEFASRDEALAALNELLDARSGLDLGPES